MKMLSAKESLKKEKRLQQEKVFLLLYMKIVQGYLLFFLSRTHWKICAKFVRIQFFFWIETKLIVKLAASKFMKFRKSYGQWNSIQSEKKEKESERNALRETTHSYTCMFAISGKRKKFVLNWRILTTNWKRLALIYIRRAQLI